MAIRDVGALVRAMCDGWKQVESGSRWVRATLLGLVVFGVCAVVQPVSAAPAAPRVCALHAVYGVIGDHYKALDGPNGPLGCPTIDESDTGDGGRFNAFDRPGMITWNPRFAPQGVAYAYQDGNSIAVGWGDTQPFNYDTFLVRVDVDGVNKSQEDVWASRFVTWWGQKENWTRQNGEYRIYDVKPGHLYQIVIAGCDYSLASGHTCRQGWSSPLWIATR